MEEIKQLDSNKSSMPEAETTIDPSRPVEFISEPPVSSKEDYRNRRSRENKTEKNNKTKKYITLEEEGVLQPPAPAGFEAVFEPITSAHEYLDLRRQRELEKGNITAETGVDVGESVCEAASQDDIITAEVTVVPPGTDWNAIQDEINKRQQQPPKASYISQFRVICKQHQWTVFLLFGLVLTSIILIILLIVELAKPPPSPPPPLITISPTPTTIPTPPPTRPSRESIQKIISNVIETYEQSPNDLLEDQSSFHYRAFVWITENDTLLFRNTVELIQRYTLALLYYVTGGENTWIETKNWLDNNVHECQWEGVIQCKDFEVLGISLDSKNLTGSLPFELAELKHLTSFNVSDNLLTSSIPWSLGAISDLRKLDLSMNHFSGQIPFTIGSLSNLNTLALYDNLLSGYLPEEISNMKSLVSLSLQKNNITENVSSYICDLNKTNLVHFTTDCLETMDCDCCTECF